MDYTTLWMGSALAAAKLSAAFCCAYLAFLWLDRRRSVPGYHILFPLLVVVTALLALRFSHSPKAGVTYAWIGTAVLGGFSWLLPTRRGAAVDGKPANETGKRNSVASRSVKADEQPGNPSRSNTPIAVTLLAATAAVFSLYAMTRTQFMTTAPLLKAAQSTMFAVGSQLIVTCALLGSVIASTVVLTLGPTGKELLQLNWKGLSRGTTFLFLTQMLLVGLGISQTRANLAAADTDSLSSATVAVLMLYIVGMATVAFIVWSIPSRLSWLSKKGQVTGHVSLAMAGWLALLCLSTALFLPAQWPWVL